MKKINLNKLLLTLILLFLIQNSTITLYQIQKKELCSEEELIAPYNNSHSSNTCDNLFFVSI